MKNKGFTLIELLGTIALVAILATSAIVAVNSLINKQRVKLATVAEEHINEAALTYFSSKKSLYIEPCLDTDNEYTTIPQYTIKEINDKFRETLKTEGITEEAAKITKAKEYATSINTDEATKNKFNEDFLDIKNTSCFRVVTVGELIENGLVEDKDNMCNKASILVVYQKGSAKNTTGVATGIQEPLICNGQNIRKQPPVITVTPNSDPDPTPKKTINIAIYDENKKLKKTVMLEYAWSTDKNREPTSSWKTLEIETDKEGGKKNKRGNKNITVKGLSDENYLWIRSVDTIDSYNNEIAAFPSGPYNFLAVMKLSYDDGGNNCSTKKKEVVYSYLYGEDIDKNEAKLCVPSKDGYDFKGWTLEGAEVKDTTEVRKKSNHTITANWDAITVPINLDKNNATNTPTNKLTIKYETSALNPSTITVPERVYTVSFNENSTGANISSTNSLESRYTFDAWNTKADGKGLDVINNSSTPALISNVSGYTNASGLWIKSTSTTLYAKWSDGNVTLPTISKTGYTCGWATSSTGDIVYNSGAIYEPTDNVTLYGKCNPNSYTITLNNNEATTNGSTSSKVTYLDTKLKKITNPKRQYKVSFNLNGTSATATTDDLPATYTLKGWYTEASGGTKVASSSTTPALQANVPDHTNASSQWTRTEGATLHAQWSSASVNLPAISKTGYSCSWNTKDNGDGDSYDGGSSYTPKKAITLYAKCTIQTYTVNLKGNGATTAGSSSTTVKYHDTSLSSITNPQRKYTVSFDLNRTGAKATTTSLTATYTLKGWYTQASGGTKVASSSTTPALQANVSNYTNKSKKWTRTEGATLHAQWSSASVNLPAISKTGYSCSWNTKDNGDGDSYDGGYSYIPTTTITLYANCTPLKYILTYDSNDGDDCDPLTKEVTYDNAYGDLCSPNRDGYSFAGWYTKEKNGTNITSRSKVEVAEDHTIYAYWTPNQFTVAYNGNGNTSGSTSSHNCTYDANCTLTTNGFTKEYANFKGWKKNNKGKTYAAGASIKNAATSGTVTYYAQWECQSGYSMDNGVCVSIGSQICVSFDANGGTTTLDKVCCMAPEGGNCTVTLPTYNKSNMCRARESDNSYHGYILKGLSSNSEASTKETCLGQNYTISNNVTLYAVWESKYAKATITLYDSEKNHLAMRSSKYIDPKNNNLIMWMPKGNEITLYYVAKKKNGINWTYVGYNGKSGYSATYATERDHRKIHFTSIQYPADSSCNYDNYCS